MSAVNWAEVNLNSAVYGRKIIDCHVGRCQQSGLGDDRAMQPSVHARGRLSGSRPWLVIRHGPQRRRTSTLARLATTRSGLEFVSKFQMPVGILKVRLQKPIRGGERPIHSAVPAVKDIALNVRTIEKEASETIRRQ